MNVERFLPYIALGVAGFLLWKFSNKIGDEAGDAAASIYAWLRGQNNVKGKVVLPDLRLVSFAGLKTSWVGDQLRTVIGGKTYQLHPHDDNGNFPATPV